MAVLLDVFRVIRDTFKNMGVGIEIISWIVGEEKEIFVEKFLKPLGEEWLERQNATKTTKKIRNEFLKLISGDESLVLDECDGTEILADASDVFAYIDSDFRKWNTDEKGPATDAAPVRVYEMTKDGIYTQMFGSLSLNVRKLCLTQAQIKGFVKKYRNWLRKDGGSTFFPFESNGEFFVASVDVYSDGRLRVDVYRFGFGSVWDAEGRYRVVALQLA